MQDADAISDWRTRESLFALSGRLNALEERMSNLEKQFDDLDTIVTNLSLAIERLGGL